MISNANKVNIGLSVILLLTILYIVYTSGTRTVSGEYEKLYNESRETIGIIQQNNRELRNSLNEFGELQEQYRQLQSEYDKINREREDDLRRREALEQAARDINTRVGDEISEGYDIIDEYRRSIQEITGSTGPSEEGL